MNKKWLLPIILGLVMVLAAPFLSGCSSPEFAQGSDTVQISQQPQGIWVNGKGEISVTPDIAVLRLGVVSQEVSVAEAMARASEAMDKIMQTLTDSGIAAKDIQTGSFNISQRSRWDDLKQMETITGYYVSNMVIVKIRDIEKAGTIIDSVAQAGGDFTRINGISFSVEDPSSYYQEVREEAINDARSRAEHLAALAGVTLGSPTYIAEGSQSSINYDSYRGVEMAVPVPAIEVSSSSISAGETKITLNVQVAYSIAR